MYHVIFYTGLHTVFRHHLKHMIQQIKLLQLEYQYVYNEQTHPVSYCVKFHNFVYDVLISSFYES